MRNQDILKIIDEYIEKSLYQYAVMINGDWGCGKTFFIEHELIPHIESYKYGRDENTKKVYYVSLYGIRDTSDISDKLCAQAIQDTVQKVGTNEKLNKHVPVRKLVEKGKTYQIVSTIANIATKTIMKKVEIGDEKDLKKFLKLFPDFNNTVIIFDDLERCSCDINDVLGYMNNFVEHSTAKVIVVANENEIGKSQADHFNELQMLVAMDDRVKVETETTEERDKKVILGDRYNPDEAKLTPEKLESRRREIFNNTEKYRRIKEKVIGETVTYEPDLKKIFSQLISTKISNQRLKDVLLYDVDILVGYANKCNHKNIRTFLFFLEKISRVFDVVENKYEVIHRGIVEYCYRTSICWMSGNKKQPEWKENEKYGYQEFGDSLIYMDTLIGFRFVDEFIRNGLIEKEEAEDTLEQFERKVREEGKLNDDPYMKIKEWYKSEDDEVEQWINKIAENVKNDVYSIVLYPELIQNLSAIAAYGLFEALIEKTLSVIVEHTKDLDKQKIVSFTEHRFFTEKKQAQIYHKYIEQIKEIAAEKENEAQKERYLRIVGDENTDWAKEIGDKMVADRTINGWSCIYWIPPERILYRLIRSKNDELCNFRRLLSCCYEGTYYKNIEDDYDHLVALKNGIKEIDMSTFGEIKTKTMKWIERDLEKYLRRYSQYTPDKDIVIEEVQ